MPNVRASSGMIGTMRLPISLSRNSSLMSAHERHGGGDLLLARALADRRRRSRRPAACSGSASTRRSRHETAERSAPVEHVLDLRERPCRGGSTAAGTGPSPARRREIGMRCRSRKSLRSSQRQLLHLVGGVAALEVLAEGVALDGVRQDHRRLALVRHRRRVRRVDLAVVVAAALEVPDLAVGDVL